MTQQVFISCSVLLCSAVISVLLLLCFSFGAHFLFFSVNVTSAKKCRSKTHNTVFSETLCMFM